MPTILFYESGYSIYVLRQASRRSWRIGQKHPVKVKFLAYAGTMQENCLRLMGKKLLVSLAMEGKFANQGLQALDDDDDILTAMARELVTEKGVGRKSRCALERNPAATHPSACNHECRRDSAAGTDTEWASASLRATHRCVRPTPNRRRPLSSNWSCRSREPRVGPVMTMTPSFRWRSDRNITQTGYAEGSGRGTPPRG